MDQERKFKGIWIPKEIWITQDLSIQEKIILVEIDSLEDEVRGCFASNKYFANFFQLSASRVSHIINDLEAKGYIELSYIKDGKEIKERQIKIKRPPYPEVLQICNRGIANTQEGYCENSEENNKDINNIKIINNIVDYLNTKANTHYKSTTNKTKTLINSRLREGFTEEDFKTVIDKKCEEWLQTDYEKFIRPDTLFGTKFESYLNQRQTIKPKRKETFSEMLDRLAREE